MPGTLCAYLLSDRGDRGSQMGTSLKWVLSTFICVLLSLYLCLWFRICDQKVLDNCADIILVVKVYKKIFVQCLWPFLSDQGDSVWSTKMLKYLRHRGKRRINDGKKSYHRNANSPSYGWFSLHWLPLLIMVINATTGGGLLFFFKPVYIFGRENGRNLTFFGPCRPILVILLLIYSLFAYFL